MKSGIVGVSQLQHIEHQLVIFRPEFILDGCVIVYIHLTIDSEIYDGRAWVW